MEVEARSFADLSQETQIAVNEKMQGVAMKKLTVQRKSSEIEYMHSGMNKPATVINFNPIALSLHDGNVPWTIPAATDVSKKGIKVPYGSRVYEAAFFTIRELQKGVTKDPTAKFIAWPTDVKKPAADDENAIAEYKPVWISQLEMADQYRKEYTNPARNMMGGVLVFQGDIHTFTKSKGTILIPRTERLADGRLSYFTEEVDMKQELAACLDTQKGFCEFMIRQGDEYNQDEQQRKNITPVHRKWDDFALKMGWKEQAAQWTSSKLDNEESCKGCGKARKRLDAWACECGRYYNALAAYLAGEPVPEAYIYALSDPKDVEQAEKEMKRRAAQKAKFEGLKG